MLSGSARVGVGSAAVAAPLDPVALVDQLFDDDPIVRDRGELLTVAGDLLQARGDRRGELIILDQAVAAASRRERGDALAARERWLRAHQAELLGEAFARFSTRRGSLRLGFFAGRLRSLTVDLRRIDAPGLAPAEILTQLLAAPGCRDLAELRVRVRQEATLALVRAALEPLERRPPIESLLVSTTTHVRGADLGRVALDDLLPDLWFAAPTGRLGTTVGREADARLMGLVRDIDAPSRAARIAIGQALTYPERGPAKAVCEALARLGPAAEVFASTLVELMQPRAYAMLPTLLDGLPSFGAWVTELRPDVARITGTSHRHWPGTGVSAIRCLAALDASEAVDLPDKPSQARG